MPSNCGKIAAGVARNCSTPLVSGVHDELILINFSDIINYVTNTSDPKIIEGFNLITSPAAAKGYLFEGFKRSTQPKTDLVPSEFRSSWNHTVVFRIFDNTPETKQIIEGLKDGSFVAIVRNNNQGVNGNAVYELYGKGVGLELTVATIDPNDADSGGAYVLTLSSPENNKESNLPAPIYLTDLPTTAALVNSLL